MKILKKDYEVETLVLNNGEPEIVKNKQPIYFVMDLKSHRMIEEELGKPLISLFSGKSADEMGQVLYTSSVMLTIASACYLDTSNGAIKHDEVSMREFKDSDLSQICMDVDFIYDIANLIGEYFGGDKKAPVPSDKKSTKK